MKTVLAIASGALLLAGCAGMATGPTATTKLEARSGSNVSGNVTFTQVGERVRIQGLVNGHTAGLKGWHIHEKGDCSDPKADSAGGHFNPRGHKHGAPT
ncbi:MAG: superoxide dismutase family protein, partial [Pseudomonadota bacterium]|nr:superoxide dismutase family protein [Pseudomonadota bacterium]